MTSRLLLLRAVLSFLALPGVVAIALPPVITSVDPFRRAGFQVGLVPLIAGFAVLLWCVRDFYVVGRGTLAPWDPPGRLVTVGLYRFVRNPMYVGIVMALAGWSVAAGSPLLGVYLAVLSVAFLLRVHLYEEPRCGRQFGEEWERYAAAVPGWVPRLTPWRR